MFNMIQTDKDSQSPLDPELSSEHVFHLFFDSWVTFSRRIAIQLIGDNAGQKKIDRDITCQLSN